jgi:HlyD family secretion protein
MKHNWILPVLAGLLGVFAIGYAIHNQRAEPALPPPVPPPSSPFGHTVAGAGMVEASTEASGTGNISVGSQLAGVVTKVAVRINQEVKEGDLLFELDPRITEATLKVHEVNVKVNEALVNAAEAVRKTNQDQWDRDKRLDKYSLADQDRVAHYQLMLNSEAQLAVAKANLDLAKAQVAQDRTTLAVLKVQAPVSGTILQVNVRPGEYVSTFAGQTLILMGNIQPMHVRVNVDEEDLPRLKLAVPAHAKVRGDARQEVVPLRFVRVEPYVVPKASLTGANTERVDTRVVQLIYAVERDPKRTTQPPVLVGQLLDVFIDTRDEASGK